MTPRARFPVPWGLFVALGVYALAVLGFVWSQYWSAPEYQAAEHYAKALLILGVDDGRKCSRQELERAFDHVLEAARLMPDVKELAEHGERLRWRFEERGFKLPEDAKRRAEAVSALARRQEQAKDPMLVVGLRDRGWGPEQLLMGPRQVVLWSIPGGALIVLFWGYLRFSARAVRVKEHRAGLEQQEREVAALGEFRRGLPEAKPSRFREEDEEPTRPEEIPEAMREAKQPSSPGRAKVKRRRDS